MNTPVQRVREQITSILKTWGMDERLVGSTVEAMVETDLAGVDSHGVSMLMDYERSREAGKLNLAAQARRSDSRDLRSGRRALPAGAMRPPAGLPDRPRRRSAGLTMPFAAP
jgi:hypothetical protein